MAFFVNSLRMHQQIDVVNEWQSMASRENIFVF